MHQVLALQAAQLQDVHGIARLHFLGLGLLARLQPVADALAQRALLGRG